MKITISSKFNNPRKLIIKYYHRVIFYFKKILPKTLLFRVIAIISITVFLAQVSISIIFYDSHWRKIRGSLISTLVNNIANIVNQANTTRSREELMAVVERFKIYSSLNPELVEITANPYINYQDEVSESRIIEELKQRIPYNPVYINKYSSDYYILKISVLIRDNYYISFYVEKDMLLDTSAFSLIAILAVLYFCSMLIIIHFIRLQVRPLRNLVLYSRQFAKGENVPYIIPSGSVEIRDTAKAFNYMTAKITTFIEQRTMMLSSISHDLKTSLTKLNLMLALSPKSPQSNDLEEEVNIMSQMIYSYLEFAKEEQLHEHKTKVVIKTFINQLIHNESYKSIKFITVFEQTAKEIYINALLMKRALDNILSNAVKFANLVQISVKNNTNHSILISVEDNGIGVPDNKKHDVFKPFYKINEARTAEKGSVGLGLYIVKDIITKHGGNVIIGTSQYGGLKIDITLPL